MIHYPIKVGWCVSQFLGRQKYRSVGWDGCGRSNTDVGCDDGHEVPNVDGAVDYCDGCIVLNPRGNLRRCVGWRGSLQVPLETQTVVGCCQ